MARDIDDEIREEEEWEAEDADDIEEQQITDEYPDRLGENTAARVGLRHTGVEYVCLTCGRKQVSRGGVIPTCHGSMIAIDFERSPRSRKPVTGSSSPSAKKPAPRRAREKKRPVQRISRAKQRNQRAKKR